MARGYERPPIWAAMVMIVSAVALVVLGLVAVNRSSGLSPSDYAAAVAANEARQAEATAAASSSAAAAEADRPRRVTFVGDSYTAGAGATDEQARWVSLLSADRGWEATNLGRGGTGYVTSLTGEQAQAGCDRDTCPDYDQMVADAAATSPDIIIVSGGRNDLPSANDDDFAARVSQFFADLRAAAPEATIVVTSPIWDSSAVPDGLAAIADAARAGAAEVGATYLDLGEPLAGAPDLISDDGIHPNDQGHQAIATAVENALVATGL